MNNNKTSTYLSALVAFVLGLVPAFAAQTIVVDPNTSYHTHDGWESNTIVSGDIVSDFNDWEIRRHIDAFTDAIVDDLGLNRLRLEIPSNVENPLPLQTRFVRGYYDHKEWRDFRYQKINDNNDPFDINWDGFQFTELDRKIEQLVLPMKERLEARGEKLFINAILVDFGNGEGVGGSDFYFAREPEEYAELMEAVFLHMDRKYGFVPTALELVLEPDNNHSGLMSWNSDAYGTTGEKLAHALIAVQARLSGHGYNPQYIATGSLNMAYAIQTFDDFLTVPGAINHLDVLSYHLYGQQKSSDRAQLYARAQAHGLKMFMSELTSMDVNDIMTETNEAHVSAIDRWALMANHHSAYMNANVSNPNNPKFNFHWHVNAMPQFFKYIRHGALEIDATGPNTIAYIDKNGSHIVVISNGSDNGPFTIEGLPAGTYGITASGKNSSGQLVNEYAEADVSISAGEDLVFSTVVASTSPASAITVFQKSGANMDIVVPTNPSNVQVTAVNSTQIDLGWTASADNVGIAGYDIYRDGRLYAQTNGTGTSYSDTRVSGASMHQYSVRARDAAENISSLIAAPLAGSATDILDTALTYTNHGTHIEITDCNVAAAGGIIIPSSLESLPVTLIANDAFWGCDQITGVIVPDGVTSIGDSAFEGCIALKTVGLPSSLTSLGVAAFKDCSNLREISVPSGITSIGDDAFRNCSELYKADLPSGLLTIGSHAFDRCEDLWKVVLPSSLTSIGDYAFRETGIIVANFGPNLNSLGKNPFAECYALVDFEIDNANTNFTFSNGGLYNAAKTHLLAWATGRAYGDPVFEPTLTTISDSSMAGFFKNYRVEIPEGVTVIEEGAFKRAVNLEKVFLPQTLTSMGKDAFVGIEDLVHVQFNSDEPTLPLETVFASSDPALTVYRWDDRSGYGDPTWRGMPVVSMGSYHAFIDWLPRNDIAHNESANFDANGDGVPLLVEYSQQMDPHKVKPNFVPLAVLNGNQLELDFYAQSPDITYTVETSADMVHWTTTGVTVGAPDGYGIAKATTPLDSAKKFIRLRVSE